MADILEAPAMPPWYVPSNRGKTLAADRLRAIADWLEKHEVKDEELVAASTDGWDEMYVNVKPECIVRLMSGKSCVVDSSGYAREHIDGMTVVCVLK